MSGTAVIIDGKILLDGELYRPCIGDPIGVKAVIASEKARSFSPSVTKGLEGKGHRISMGFSCPFCGTRHHDFGTGKSAAWAKAEVEEKLFGDGNEGLECKCGVIYGKRGPTHVGQLNR